MKGKSTASWIPQAASSGAKLIFHATFQSSFICVSAQHPGHTSLQAASNEDLEALVLRHPLVENYISEDKAKHATYLVH